MENLQLANRIHHHDHVYHKTENTLVCQWQCLVHR
jgi:hypothetical protein